MNRNQGYENQGYKSAEEILSAKTFDRTDNLPNVKATADPINSEAHIEINVELDVDQFFKEINDFGAAQKIFLLILCFMMFPPTYQYFIMTFIANNPPWTCLSNVLCNSSRTYAVEDSFYGKRCELPKNAWNFTKPSSYSIVTEV